MGMFCSANLLWLLLPLLIGLLTGWWTWAGRKAEPAYAAPEPQRFVAPEPALAPVAPPAPPPVAVAPAQAPAPVAAPVAAAAAALTAIGIPAAIGTPDDLLKIKGVGPKLNELLISLGVRRFDQISKWTGGDIEKVDSHLGAFKGRIVRDSWVEQAGLLARGAFEEFERKFGIIDSENKPK